MSRFEYALYEISGDEHSEEHLVQYRVSSPYEAIRMCLDKTKRLDYISITFVHNDQEFAEISPYATWKTWDEFEKQLKTHMLAHQIQLNHELTLDQAAEQMLIHAHDNKRLTTKPK